MKHIVILGITATMLARSAPLQKISLLVFLTFLLNGCEDLKNYSELKENASTISYINYLKIKNRTRVHKKTVVDLGGTVPAASDISMNSKNPDRKWPSPLPDWLVPPPKDSMVAQVMTTYVNPETGESYEANTAGFTIVIK